MYKLRLPARLDSLEKFLEFISGFAEEKGFASSRIKAMKLSAEEALSNIISYAYPSSAGDVEITYKQDDDTKLIFEILDNGIPFDPLSLSDPDLTADISERKVGGLGLILMRVMADDVRYRRDEDSNILTLVFSK